MPEEQISLLALLWTHGVSSDPNVLLLPTQNVGHLHKHDAVIGWTLMGQE